jgi:hypothetical protein
MHGKGPYPFAANLIRADFPPRGAAQCLQQFKLYRLFCVRPGIGFLIQIRTCRHRSASLSGFPAADAVNHIARPAFCSGFTLHM